MIVFKVICDNAYLNESGADVQLTGDQQNGAGDVQLSRVGVDLRRDNAEELRDDGTEGLQWPGAIPTCHVDVSNKKLESSLASRLPLPPPNSSTSPIPMFGITNSSTPPPPPKTPYEQQTLQQVHLRKPVKATTVARNMSPPNTSPSPFHFDSPSPSTSTSSDDPHWRHRVLFFAFHCRSTLVLTISSTSRSCTVT
jgi:hypothetical protein